MTAAGRGNHVALAFYKNARDEANHQSKKKNWDFLWQVLEEIGKSKRPDFSVSSVGKQLEAAGGMTTQSLRNKGGANMRRLIELYASGRNPNASIEAHHDRHIALIEDSGIRAAMRIQMEELRRSKTENDCLKAIISSTQLTVIHSGMNKDLNAGANPLPEMPTHYVAALRTGIDQERLLEQGLSIREDGAILNSKGNALFPAGFAHAIDHLLNPPKH